MHLKSDPSAGYQNRGLFIKIGRDGNYDNSAAHYDIVGSSGNSGFHAFEVQGTEALRINKNRRVGIGTDNPAHLVHIQDATTPRLVVEDTTNNVQAQIGADNTEARIGTASDHPISFRINDVEKALLDTSGRLLIGTTTEGEVDGDDLTIATTGNTGITIRSGTTNTGIVQFSDGTSGTSEYKGYVQYAHSNDTLRLASAGLVAVTIDNNQDTTFAGTVTDSKGNLRSIPIQSNSGSHTLTAASAGKVLYTDANTNLSLIHI